MSQTRWSKIKSKHNLRLFILTIILAILGFILLPFAFLFGLVAIISKNTMLTALIEAEATILGFYELVVVYALTSHDNRIDRLEQQIFDMQTKSAKQRNAVLFENLPKRKENIQKAKSKMVYSALYVNILLFGSLLSSILALGFPIEEWALYLSIFSTLLLFGSFVEIFWSIYDLGKTSE